MADSTAPAALRLSVAARGAGTDAIVLTVEDHAQALDPTRVPAPPGARSLAETRIGGLGVYMVRHCSRAMEYVRIGDTNRLVVTLPTRSRDSHAT